MNIKRDKLEATTKKCTFIGYMLDDMGYHFCDYRLTKKVISSMDIVFNKSALYKYEIIANPNREKNYK